MSDLALPGCAPIPLAHYLKALGILRLVSEQADPEATGWWEHDYFYLSSKFDATDLINFFLNDYSPTPIIAPWNGGSGFYPKDNTEAIKALATSESPRFSAYKKAIEETSDILTECGLKKKPEAEEKLGLLKACRNRLPEEVLSWLDAVFVLSGDGVKYPPLLGTGGNDGRLEFTNNFMQQIASLIDPATGEIAQSSPSLLRQALFAEVAPGTVSPAAIGQYFPGAAGGANSTSGFDGKSAVNSWDFILMIEGALLFAAASTKKLEAADVGQLVYPFCVRQAGVGYGSAATSDEIDARCEMWMPLWKRPTRVSELRAVFGEGRAQVNGRPARNGVDFTRAAVTLGVDRGLSAFQRYGFQVRNGLAYFATPLERVVVKRNARADLLADVDHWLDRLRSKTGPKSNPPASVTRALNQLEAKILDLCKNDDPAHTQGVLIALGRAQKALAHSLRWTKSDTVNLRPLVGLRALWAVEAETNRAEFRLALALASTHGRYGDKELFLRQHLEPVEFKGKWLEWAENSSNDVVWHDGDFVDVLNAIFARRVMKAIQTGSEGFPDESSHPARLDDLAAFIDERTDNRLLADLVWGLSLIDWPHPKERPSDETPLYDRVAPSSLYALLRLCFRPKHGEEKFVPAVAAIHRHAAQGNGTRASALAEHRLFASGYEPAVDKVPVADERLARRTAAALLFPVAPALFLPTDPKHYSYLQQSILRTRETTQP